MMRSKFKFLALIALGFTMFYLPVQATAQASSSAKLAQLEKAFDGKIGVSAIDTSNNRRIEYRAHERFPMGCTSKVMGVAAILKKSMSDNAFLQQKIFYSKKDLVIWTPITEKHLKDGMSICALSAAAIRYSDNTAMNLLAKKIGGPEGITHYARSIGDKTFQLDHWWPDEALANPGDAFDSTTPAAMEKSLQRITFGEVLAAPQRKQLLNWLIHNTTGNLRIRAGVSKGWIVGDKTGTNFYYGTANDIGIIWAPKCSPIIAAIYFTGNKKNTPRGDAAVAKATRIIIQDFSEHDSCLKLAKK